MIDTIARDLKLAFFIVGATARDILEIIVCIENAVASRRIDIDRTLENARRIRQLTAGHPISTEDFSRAKAEGRL